MSTKIQQWGNSLGVRIPKELADQFNITNGSPVSIQNHEGNLVISPLAKEKTLVELCAMITKKNKHTGAWEEEAPVGNEVW